MDALEAIRKRCSSRSFKDKPIPKDVLEQICDAGRLAPTARNVQPWQFVAVTDKKVMSEISGLAENGRFVSGAAACVMVFCDDTKYYLEDGSAATQNILLAAQALGVGSCWIAGDKKDYCSRVSALVAAPARLKLVSLIALGYPDAAGPSHKDKKPLAELLHWERF